MTTECQEVAATLDIESVVEARLATLAGSFDSCLAVVREAMPDEGTTICDNFAESLMWRAGNLLFRRRMQTRINATPRRQLYRVAGWIDDAADLVRELCPGELISVTPGRRDWRVNEVRNAAREIVARHVYPYNVPAGSDRGAPMGRHGEQGDPDYSGKLALRRVPLVEGYDKGGAYWGLRSRGEALFCAWSPDRSIVRFLDASGYRAARAALVEDYPSATIKES